MARALFDVPTIAVLCRAKGIQQIDRGVSAGQSLGVTRAISGHTMREPVFGARFPDSPLRRVIGAGFSYALFEARYGLRLPPITEVLLTLSDPDVQSVAAELELTP